jgi:hypothetical protein
MEYVEVNVMVMVCTTLQVGKSSLDANSSDREDETGEDGFCLLVKVKEENKIK